MMHIFSLLSILVNMLFSLYENYIKILKMMTPIIPHFANECLEQLDANDKNIWPDVEKNLLEKIEYNIVIQINGKKRDLLKLNKAVLIKKVTAKKI